MKITLNGKKQKSKFKKGKISVLLSKLSLRTEEVIVKVNGKPVPEDTEISDKDKVEIIKVVFGG
ncbi:MoaD/ThiS family protein [Candidatus Micrarchaeota archaeon]|nr:MoaD/ThiS family protein [Candidatus Micrarchaeota archaeon]